MGRYNLVQIGTVYLTDTGLVGGTPCRVRVGGLPLLSLSHTGVTRPQASGRPITQLATIKGLPVSVTVEWQAKAVHEAILAEFQDSIDGNTDFDLVITGDTGDFNLTAIPEFPRYTDFPGDFSNEIIQQVSYFMRTT